MDDVVLEGLLAGVLVGVAAVVPVQAPGHHVHAGAGVGAEDRRLLPPVVVGARAPRRQHDELPGGRVAHEDPPHVGGDGDEAVAVRGSQEGVGALQSQLLHLLDVDGDIGGGGGDGGGRLSSRVDAVEADQVLGRRGVVRVGVNARHDGEHRWRRRAGGAAGEREVAAREGTVGDGGAPRAAHGAEAQEGFDGQTRQHLGDQQVVRDGHGRRRRRRGATDVAAGHVSSR